VEPVAAKEFTATYRWMTSVFRDAPLKLDLRKMADGADSMGIVDSWDAKRWEKYSPHQLADEIIDVAKEDAKAFKGTQAYVILCYREAREEHTNRHVFHVKGTRFDDGMEESEAPTEKGYTSQMMRHNEQMMRLAYRTIETANAQILQQSAEMQKTVAQLSQERFDVVELIQTLMDRREERKIMVMKETNTEELRRDLMAMGKRLFPMMGMKALPGNATLEQMTIEMFLETLQPAQIDRIVMLLNKEQTAMLFRVMASKGKDKDSLMKMIGSLSDEQYPAVMGCLNPDQVGVLGEWFLKQQQDSASGTGSVGPEKIPDPFNKNGVS